MRRLQEIEQERMAMNTMLELTSAFEGIASMRISQVKGQVQQAQQFFNELWQIYMQIRVDALFQFGRQQQRQKVNDKELFIAVTAEGGFSGDIDQKLINWMLTQYDPAKHDIIVIGHHGALQLAHHDVTFKKYFKLPEKDRNINVIPLIKEVQQYKNTTVYYQTYVSLMVQDVKRISLNQAIQEQSKHVGSPTDVISEKTYIFEPSTYDVVAHLESSMLQITLSQVILDSKLAQYASRFRAMSMAHEKTDELAGELGWLYNRIKRSSKDERLKEIINGLRKVSAV